MTTTTQRDTTTTARISRDVYDRLRAYCDRRGIILSRAVSMAVRDYLDNMAIKGRDV